MVLRTMIESLHFFYPYPGISFSFHLFIDTINLFVHWKGYTFTPVKMFDLDKKNNKLELLSC